MGRKNLLEPGRAWAGKVVFGPRWAGFLENFFYPVALLTNLRAPEESRKQKYEVGAKKRKLVVRNFKSFTSLNT